jgi:hypothetical protein
MVSHLFYYQLALLAIIWLFVMLPVTGSKPGLPAPPVLAKPKRKRSTEPKAFEGLTQKPHCVLCKQETGETQPPPPIFKGEVFCKHLIIMEYYSCVSCPSPASHAACGMSLTGAETSCSNGGTTGQGSGTKHPCGKVS